VISHLVAIVGYGAIAGAALWVMVSERRGSRNATQRARHLLIGCVTAATLLAGVSQRDLWPVSSWALMTGVPRADMGVSPPYLRLRVVDDAGAEYPVDYRSVEPFAVEELMAWMRKHFLSLPADDQHRAAGFVLDRIDAARARVRLGFAPGSQGRWLGQLRAPFHNLHPRQWTNAESVPATPFVALRVYGETWNLETRAVDPTQVTRTLLYEYRR
jgi:hypothetical protein